MFHVKHSSPDTPERVSASRFCRPDRYLVSPWIVVSGIGMFIISVLFSAFHVELWLSYIIHQPLAIRFGVTPPPMPDSAGQFPILAWLVVHLFVLNIRFPFSDLQFVFLIHQSACLMRASPREYPV